MENKIEDTMKTSEEVEENKKSHSKGKNKELDKMKEKITELEERLLRNQAELQNYKRRKEEEVEKSIKFSNELLIKELLPILDNFERAIEMDDEDLDDEVSKFLEGFKMIYCSYVNILEQFGVKEIEALDKKFDPNFHQAILTESFSDREDEIVLEVLQKGYTLNDRVIRPAMVKVNINNEKEKENDNNE